MQALARIASWMFGLSLLGLSLFVSLETVLRKVFSYSFEGADELGGYVLAVSSGLAFTVALIDRAHIRIDIVYQRLPARIQVLLDWLAILSLAVFGGFLLYVGRIALMDTLAYGSTAPTPWATPLIYPQALWYGALALFALVAALLAMRASFFLWRGQTESLTAQFHPRGTMEELEEELSELERRPAAAVGRQVV